MATMKERARVAVEGYPGSTASQIAKLIGERRMSNGYGTTSSALVKLAHAGLVFRKEDAKGTWRYYPPRTAYVGDGPETAAPRRKEAPVVAIQQTKCNSTCKCKEPHIHQAVTTHKPVDKFLLEIPMDPEAKARMQIRKGVERIAALTQLEHRLEDKIRWFLSEGERRNDQLGIKEVAAFAALEVERWLNDYKLLFP